MKLGTAISNLSFIKFEIENTQDTKQSKRIKKESIDIALSAIRKQIPMKAKEVHVDEYFCPACGAENNCNDGIVGDAFCPECGQALCQECNSAECEPPHGGKDDCEFYHNGLCC